MSFIYGFTGTTNLYTIAQNIEAAQNVAATPLPHSLVIVSLLLVLVGFAFKISAAPFHFWAPDVYEGAPTPVAGFLSTASKAAGFAVLLRVLLSAFGAYSPVWIYAIGGLAALSMFVGNLLALSQKNIKRLLAYSSIAQAGYILIGVAANNSFGTSGAVYYLISYLLTNLAAFGIVTLIGRVTGSDQISSYAGLSRRSPGLALGLLVALLSLGGIPPFAGFLWQTARLWGSHSGSAVLAGGDRDHQLGHRFILLPGCFKGGLPVSFGRREQTDLDHFQLEVRARIVYHRRGGIGCNFCSGVRLIGSGCRGCCGQSRL